MPLMSKKMMTVILTLLIICLAFSVSESLDFPYTAHVFLPERLSNHCQGLRRTFFEIRTKFDAVPLSDPSRNRIRSDTRLKIKGRKNQYIHPAA
jgi:hypothetical protein